mmetsp:Transcript_33368/g.82668  ORF Transcript_33368/g.82668 Transcript_33368/m.82668 type:complete len:226 (-) Transcript_33368:1329-2006(-)
MRRDYLPMHSIHTAICPLRSSGNSSGSRCPSCRLVAWPRGCRPPWDGRPLVRRVEELARDAPGVAQDLAPGRPLLVDDLLYVGVDHHAVWVHFVPQLTPLAELGVLVVQILVSELVFLGPVGAAAQRIHDLLKTLEVLAPEGGRLGVPRPVHDDADPARVLSTAGAEPDVVSAGEPHLHREVHAPLRPALDELLQTPDSLGAVAAGNRPLVDVLPEKAVEVEDFV